MNTFWSKNAAYIATVCMLATSACSETRSTPLATPSNGTNAGKSSQTAKGSGEQIDEAIALSDVPQIVLSAAAGAVSGGTIIAAAYEDENGRMLYGLSVSDGAGLRYDVKVDAQGNVVKIEDDNDSDSAADGDAIEEEVENEDGDADDEIEDEDENEDDDATTDAG